MIEPKLKVYVASALFTLFVFLLSAEKKNYSLFIQSNHACQQQNFLTLSFISLTIIFRILTKWSKSVHHNYRVYPSSKKLRNNCLIMTLSLVVTRDHCTTSWSLVVTVTTNKELNSRNHVRLPQCLIATSKTIFRHNDSNA